MRKVILISKVSHLTGHKLGKHNCDSCETIFSQYNNETEHKEILSVSKHANVAYVKRHLPKSDDEWMVRALYKLMMDGWSTGQIRGQ